MGTALNAGILSFRGVLDDESLRRGEVVEELLGDGFDIDDDFRSSVFLVIFLSYVYLLQMFFKNIECMTFPSQTSC